MNIGENTVPDDSGTVAGNSCDVAEKQGTLRFLENSLYWWLDYHALRLRLRDVSPWGVTFWWFTTPFA